MVFRILGFRFNIKRSQYFRDSMKTIFCCRLTDKVVIWYYFPSLSMAGIFDSFFFLVVSAPFCCRNSFCRVIEFMSLVSLFSQQEPNTKSNKCVLKRDKKSLWMHKVTARKSKQSRLFFCVWGSRYERKFSQKTDFLLTLAKIRFNDQVSFTEKGEKRQIFFRLEKYRLVVVSIFGVLQPRSGIQAKEIHIVQFGLIREALCLLGDELKRKHNPFTACFRVAIAKWNVCNVPTKGK